MHEIGWGPDDVVTGAALHAEMRAELSRLRADVAKAVEIAMDYGTVDGAHHKQWVIDQMLRTLAGDTYESIIEAHKAGEYGPETYEWDEGIAP